MWYLYMLIGLYLITPVIKPFVVKASNKDWLAALGLFVCPVIIIPDFECRGSWIDRVYDFSTPYLFIYLLGYWLCWKIPQKIYGNKMLLIVIIILCIGIIITKCYYRLDVYGYATPVVICLASALFLLFKSLNMNWNIANKLAPYCLGIYLMHPVFINFVYKFLNINEEMVVPILNFIGFFLLFTL